MCSCTYFTYSHGLMWEPRVIHFQLAGSHDYIVSSTAIRIFSSKYHHCQYWVYNVIVFLGVSSSCTVLRIRFLKFFILTSEFTLSTDEQRRGRHHSKMLANGPEPCCDDEFHPFHTTPESWWQNNCNRHYLAWYISVIASNYCFC